MQLESTTFLGSDKFGVINVAITIPVVHLQNGIDHLRELNVGEDFRGTRRRGIGAQVLALLNMPVNQRLDQFAAVQLVVVIIIVHLEVVELKLFLGHLANIGLTENAMKMFLNVFSVLDPALVVKKVRLVHLIGHGLAITLLVRLLLLILRWRRMIRCEMLGLLTHVLLLLRLAHHLLWISLLLVLRQ